MSISSDARLLELEFLSKLERKNEILFKGEAAFYREMAAHLVYSEMLNQFDFLESPGVSGASPAGWNLQDIVLSRRLELIRSILAGKEVTLKISHKGRIRRWDLQEQLRSEVERDQSGLLLDARYLQRDLRITTLDATPNTPVAVALFDMNGLKFINDVHGHSAGTNAIRAYFQAIADTATQSAQNSTAYRFGGDEVVLIIPSTTAHATRLIVLAIFKKLASHEIPNLGPLSASCGVALVVDDNQSPEESLMVADRLMYTAKKAATAASIDGNTRKNRPSSLLVEGRQVELVEQAGKTDHLQP